MKLDEPYKELVIKYQQIQGNCLKEGAKKKNVAENVKVAYSAIVKCSQVQLKGLGKSV